jgi:hypothetical protein
MGGYRKGSGRSKSGYYKGIYCGSTYELCWAIYNIDNNIKFERFPGKIEKDGLVYYPDFLLDDGKTIIETKGYEKKESVDKKTKLAESFGYTVAVLRKDDLQYAFDYVERTYKTKKFYELYDDYKPKYSHTCDYCKKMFETDRKVKTESKFCTRSCAGKYRKQHNVGKINVENGKYKRTLDKKTALEIYHRNDKSLQGLAEEYHLPKNNIWFIKQKKTYKWIHE